MSKRTKPPRPRDTSYDLLNDAEIKELSGATDESKLLLAQFSSVVHSSHHWKPEEKTALGRWKTVAIQVVDRINKGLEDLDALQQKTKDHVPEPDTVASKADVIASMNLLITSLHHSLPVTRVFSTTMKRIYDLNPAGFIKRHPMNSHPVGERFIEAFSSSNDPTDPKALLKAMTVDDSIYTKMSSIQRPMIYLPLLYHLLNILRLTNEVSLRCQEGPFHSQAVHAHLHKEGLQSVSVLELLPQFNPYMEMNRNLPGKLSKSLKTLSRFLKFAIPSCPTIALRRVKGLLSQVQSDISDMIIHSREALRNIMPILEKGLERVSKSLQTEV
ncbi:hypothetical protein BJ684DRAFT_14844 [Piptocephalis cylindrospora]|uniref:Uncharacterized protein n=1 Tax=Piptocephalis cylindrospora TaxID=1907219 RepID=A0A4P9Y6X1_9FUNG|nr:hypothetical protein BJ684DRAFT_14844 [Piptocephalis cylindrospora]|eukprot:RKP14866.1 hypothetical protein BJ684DRAFT_14844 [Piptocephalis cylindrospora]